VDWKERPPFIIGCCRLLLVAEITVKFSDERHEKIDTVTKLSSHFLYYSAIFLSAAVPRSLDEASREKPCDFMSAMIFSLSYEFHDELFKQL
jgi:hypothetical protein